MIISVSLATPADKKPRKQSGVVPYRKRKDGTVEILLIKTSHANNWGFPKGGIEKGMTAVASALKEAYEEAGVLGKPKDFIDVTRYVKGSTGRRQKVEWFVMKVKTMLDDYDESMTRDRKWFKAEKALKKVDKKLVSVLEQALEIIDTYGM